MDKLLYSTAVTPNQLSYPPVNIPPPSVKLCIDLKDIISLSGFALAVFAKSDQNCKHAVCHILSTYCRLAQHPESNETVAVRDDILMYYSLYESQSKTPRNQ
jgi:hypothetical protein